MYSTRCAEAGIFECFHRWGKYVQRFGSVFIHWIITFQAYLGISVKRFASDVVGPKVREMDENESMDPSIIKGLFEQGVSYFARRISSGALWLPSAKLHSHSLWVSKPVQITEALEVHSHRLSLLLKNWPKLIPPFQWCATYTTLSSILWLKHMALRTRNQNGYLNWRSRRCAYWLFIISVKFIIWFFPARLLLSFRIIVWVRRIRPQNASKKGWRPLDN